MIPWWQPCSLSAPSVWLRWALHRPGVSLSKLDASLALLAYTVVSSCPPVCPGRVVVSQGSSLPYGCSDRLTYCWTHTQCTIPYHLLEQLNMFRTACSFLSCDNILLCLRNYQKDLGFIIGTYLLYNMYQFEKISLFFPWFIWRELYAFDLIGCSLSSVVLDTFPINLDLERIVEAIKVSRYNGTLHGQSNRWNLICFSCAVGGHVQYPSDIRQIKWFQYVGWNRGGCCLWWDSQTVKQKHPPNIRGQDLDYG